MNWFYWIGNGLWTFPDGLAVLIAGLLALLAAVIAWKGVQAQIAAQTTIETTRLTHEVQLDAERLKHERFTLANGLTAELLTFSAAVIESISMWNVRALETPNGVPGYYPVFPEPLVYKSLVSKLGLIEEGWPAAATINFYGNLLELTDIAREGMAGRPSYGQTNAKVAARLGVMATNAADALSGLNNEKQFPVPLELRLDELATPGGTVVSSFPSPPSCLQELLHMLAGRPYSNHAPK